MVWEEDELAKISNTIEYKGEAEFQAVMIYNLMDRLYFMKDTTRLTQSPSILNNEKSGMDDLLSRIHQKQRVLTPARSVQQSEDTCRQHYLLANLPQKNKLNQTQQRMDKFLEVTDAKLKNHQISNRPVGTVGQQLTKLFHSYRQAMTK